VRVRYGSWSGTQDPFPAEVDADAVMDAIGEDLLNGMSPQEALERFLRRGQRGGFRGLDELRRRVAGARRRELERMGLEDRMREVAQRLAEIVERERTALHFSAADDAEARGAQLDDLPTDVASRLAALESHRWEDGRAEADFRELVDSLRREVAEATFGRMAGALGSMSPDDLERMHDLLAELNGLVAARERGEDTSEAFDAFKQRYGDLLPGDPSSLDELLEELARRMAAMSRLMASMSPDQREQLAQMAAGLLGQGGLSLQAEQLQRSLQGMFPGLGWDEGVPGASPTGSESGSISQAVDWVEHLQEMEDLGTALGQRYPGARLEDVDAEALRRTLGDEAVRDLRALQEVERALEEAGALRRNSGRLELTPRGVRRLGERSLARIYERAMTGQTGSHRTAAAGGEGELTGATRPWRFGDPFRLDVGRTIANGILRSAAAAPERRGGRHASVPRGVRLAPDDFELAEAEQRIRAATVLLLDMSFSMPLRGNWAPAKRMALALQSLVSSKFPEDRFYVVGFSDYARRLQPADLLVTGWERVYGTNMQHAFLLARRLLNAHPSADKQVIMVTDGEPTAHLEGNTPWFNWPPEPKTLRLTMAEAARLAKAGATLNVFLLDHDPGAAAFVERMVSAVGGRIFYPDLADLGSLVVRDFLSRRAA